MTCAMFMSCAPFAIPDQQLPDPTRRLSPEFLRAYPSLSGLWMPSKLFKAAADFSPVKKKIGALNGGVTVAPGGAGIFGEAWSFTTSGLITISPGVYPVAPFTLVFEIAYTTTDNLVIWEVNGNSGWSIQTASANLGGTGCPAGALFVNSATGSFTASKTAWNDGKSHLVEIVAPSYGTGVTSLFVDGADDTGSTHNLGAPTYAGAPMYFGSRNGSIGFGGSIGLAGVFNAAHSIGQASALYSSLLYGEPYRLLAAGVMERFYGGAAVATVKERRTLSQYGTRTGSRQAA